MGVKVSDVWHVKSLSGTDPALAPYHHLILSSWTKSLRGNNEFFGLIDMPVFFQVYKVLIAQILNRPTTEVRLALLNDDEDVCVGWAVVEGDVLHYVYVKGDINARRNGIAKRLVGEGITTITHITKLGKKIWQEKMPNVKFNPFK
jgi:hypothetical protein